MRFILLGHIKDQAKERNIDIKIIEATISNPGQIVPEAKGLKIAQRKYLDKSKNKEYLIRVVFREEKETRIGITAYLTSKVKKYWRQENENQI
jgi:hypothetical protein|tara:strand:+ start:446 stop:724 length:279 start_codon:yes stop_codon:yes gene_type:complete